MTSVTIVGATVEMLASSEVVENPDTVTEVVAWPTDCGIASVTVVENTVKMLVSSEIVVDWVSVTKLVGP